MAVCRTWAQVTESSSLLLNWVRVYWKTRVNHRRRGICLHWHSYLYVLLTLKKLSVKVSLSTLFNVGWTEFSWSSTRFHYSFKMASSGQGEMLYLTIYQHTRWHRCWYVLWCCTEHWIVWLMELPYCWQWQIVWPSVGIFWQMLQPHVVTFCLADVMPRCGRCKGQSFYKVNSF